MRQTQFDSVAVAVGLRCSDRAAESDLKSKGGESKSSIGPQTESKSWWGHYPKFREVSPEDMRTARSRLRLSGCDWKSMEEFEYAPLIPGKVR
ncbi:MAG: hypothetical protein C0623_09440 [Desulfuromonas sp.]|nr:MAG: hypothetical protein C0623_09440 [Desulfuromonas sp.]